MKQSAGRAARATRYSRTTKEAARQYACQIIRVKALLLITLTICVFACGSGGSSINSACSTSASSPCGGPLVLPAIDRYAVCKAHWTDYGNLATYVGCDDYSLSAYTPNPCDGFRLAVFQGVDDSVRCYFEADSGALISIIYDWQCESCVAGPPAGIAVPEIESCVVQRRASEVSSCPIKDASAEADTSPGS